MEFEKHYRRDTPVASTAVDTKLLDKIEPHAAGIKAFFAQYSGATFNGGLYRVLTVGELTKWTAVASAMFPDLQGKILVFATDWRGQFYAINSQRKEGSQYQVQLLDPATGESLGIPASFASFHEAELVEYPEDSLQVSLFQAWVAEMSVVPSSRQCVGYIKPLTLGGIDETANQEITDMEVYWSLNTQLQQKIARLPDGTSIDKIDLQ